jgi:hypothetical protein
MRFPLASAAFEIIPDVPDPVIPPTAGVYDPAWQSVLSLIRFEGTNGQARLDDDSGRGWVRNGNAQIDTSTFLAGSASGLFDGTGDFYNTLNNGEFDFGAGDFTIEAAVKPTSGTAGLHVILSNRAVGATAKGWEFYIDDTGHAGTFTCSFTSWNSAGTVVHSAGGTITFGTSAFTRLAVSRVGSSFYLLVNGVIDKTITAAGTIGASGVDVYLGRENASVTREYKGWIDAARITKGLGRYNANYTPVNFLPLPNTTVGTNIDNFDTDTTGNYTQTADTNCTWTVSGGNLTTNAAGANSLFLVNGMGTADGTFSVVMSQSGNGGIVARCINNSNYYLCAVFDASSTAGLTNTVAIYRRIAGTLTLISSVAVTFVRGVSHKLTFTLSGTSLIALFDDVQVLSVTDSNITASGKYGLRNNTQINVFNSFTYPIKLTYSYYRLKVPTVNGGTGFNVASLNLRTAIAGADVATGGTASATSNATGFEPAKAFDSDATTMYKSTGPSPQWLTYVFPSIVDIQEIGIQAPPSSYGSLIETPKNFTFEYSSDNVNWSTLISAVGQTAWSYGQTRSYNRATGTYTADVGVPPPDPPPDPMTPYPSRVRGTTVISVLLHGAVGNGVTNNVAAFNASIAALPSDGGTILVPDGDYLIDVSDTVSVNLRSNMHLELSDNARIICKPNNHTNYYMLRAKLVHDVEISGGQIIGDRVGHIGTTGEWGYGVRLEGATKVTVHDTKVSNCWGDGLIAGGSSGTYADDIWFWNVISDNNRRQAITIGLAKNGRIEGCTLTNTNGTAPQAGIDFEPDSGPAFNWVVKNNIITGNAGAGILMWQHTSHDIVINNNTVNSNHWGIYGDSVSNIEVSNNICRSNSNQGIRVGPNNNNWVVTANRLGRNSGGADRIPDQIKTGYDGLVSTQRDLLVVTSSSTNISVLSNTFE